MTPDETPSVGREVAAAEPNSLTLDNDRRELSKQVEALLPEPGNEVPHRKLIVTDGTKQQWAEERIWPGVIHDG